VPDVRKGERLVVVHLATGKTPEQIGQELSAAGLPNLFIPSPDSFIQVDQIPVLGTGKLDLKGIRDIALARFGPATAAPSAARR
jgi:acyl-[acyl-carrier-protein]-phospholipid O-acyltransferase/long-chain-fatty-acid--[acyl-carrier-protein] ligase